jgi:class 3 adenylate cyclase
LSPRSRKLKRWANRVSDLGMEVNFAFRLETPAASLGEACGLSDAASSKLEGSISSRRLGDYELKGFGGKRSFLVV